MGGVNGVKAVFLGYRMSRSTSGGCGGQREIHPPHVCINSPPDLKTASVMVPLSLLQDAKS